MDRVLLVEQDPDTLVTQSQWLMDAGFRTRSANGFANAVPILESELVDVLVCGLGCRGSEGHRLLAHVRDEAPSMPVVVVTAAVTLPEAVEAMRSGAWDFVARPTSRELLVSAVQRAAEHRHVQETSALTRAAAAVFRTLDAEDLVPIVLNVARDMLQATAAAVTNPGGRIVAGGLDTTDLPMGKVASDLVPFRGLVGSRWVLGLPLVTRSRLHGELWLVRTAGPHPFTAREAERAMILAGQVSLALDNAHLVLELRERVDALGRARGRIAAAERMESVGRFATQIAEQLGTPLAYVRSQLRELGAATNHASVGYALDGLARVEHIAHDLELVAGTRDLLRFELSSIVALAVRISGVSVTTGHFEDVVLQGHPGRLAQALAEVFDNATALGGALTVSARVIREFVELAVVDDGPGIPEDVLPHVTEPHFSTSGGAGLGLAVAREIAEQMGGTLRVASRCGSGTSVVFLLPAEAVTGEFPTDEAPL